MDENSFGKLFKWKQANLKKKHKLYSIVSVPELLFCDLVTKGRGISSVPLIVKNGKFKIWPFLAPRGTELMTHPLGFKVKS